MILGTVGMHTDGFPRLVDALDRVAMATNEEVMVQIGATRGTPQAACWFRFISQAQMDCLVGRARIVVSHAGAGSILQALRHAKPLIVMPRLKRHGEHLDDHQCELALALAEAGVLLLVWDAGDLGAALQEAENFVPHIVRDGRLIAALRSAVQAGVS